MGNSELIAALEQAMRTIDLAYPDSVFPHTTLSHLKKALENPRPKRWLCAADCLGWRTHGNDWRDDWRNFVFCPFCGGKMSDLTYGMA